MITSKLPIALATALVVGAMAAGTASAQQGPGQRPQGAKAGQAGKPGCRGANQAAATFLGLTAEQLKQRLKAGQTLAQIATSLGKTVAGLAAAIVAEAKQNLDNAVAAGQLTAAQAAQRLGELQSNVTNIVNGVRP